MNRPRCPGCGHKLNQMWLGLREKQRYRCSHCNETFTATEAALLS